MTFGAPLMAEDLQKDQDLWFEDGNIVIIADSTTAFRVYKGPLARVSTVFRDMFNSPSLGEEFEDCPVVRVPETPTEISHFLRGIFIPGDSLSQQGTLPFALVASTIRVGHKYEAQDIVAAASSRLENFLIAGPGHWIDSSLSWKGRWELGQKQCGIAFEVENAIEAVNLARLLEKPPMLPVGLYLCCLVDPIQLRNGVARADGILEKLSDEDFARCVRALPILMAECRATALRALRILKPNMCPGCSRRFGDSVDFCACDVTDGPALALSDMFVRLDVRGSGIRPEVVHSWLCAACSERWLARSAQECLRMREKLSEYFSLEEKKEKKRFDPNTFI